MAEMFRVVMGQDGDDYECGYGKDLIEAAQLASDWAKKMNRNPVGQRTTYIYILTPEGDRVNIPYKTL